MDVCRENRSTFMRAPGIVITFSFFFSVMASAAAPLWPEYGSSDVLLLENQTTKTGTFKKCTEETLYFEVDGITHTFPVDDVWALSLGDAAVRADLDVQRAALSSSAESWYYMGIRYAKHKLGVEAVLCYQHTLTLDPDYAKAHRILGHAQLDGRWLKRDEVKRRCAAGYTKKEDRLIPPSTSKTQGRTEVKKPDKAPEGIRFLTAPQWSQRELRGFENERRERKEKAEEFKKQLEQEFRGVPWRNRYIIKTSHFEVICDSTRSVAEHYAQLMEKLYAQLTKRFPKYRFGKTGKAQVYIYKNQDEFCEKTRMFYGVGGFYNSRTGNLRTYHGTFGLTMTTFNVLAHEGTHLFQGKVLQDFDNVPIWLLEGLAVYFGDGSRMTPSGDIKTGIVPRDRLLHIQDKIKEGKQDRLDKLVTIPHREFSGTHYADAWGFIYFLVSSGKKGQDLLSAYWNIATKRKIRFDDFQKLAEIHSGSLIELENGYLDFIKKLVPQPAGEIRGEYFYSREFCFEFKMMGEGWRFFDKNEKAYLVGQRASSGSGTIDVLFRNNDARAQSGEDYVKQFITQYHERILPAVYDDIKAERVSMHGVDAFRFMYKDKPSAGGLPLTLADLTNYQLLDLIEKLQKKAKEGGGNRQYVEYLIVDFDGTFSIKASAKEDEFDRYKETFLKIHEYFEPIQQRRW